MLSRCDRVCAQWLVCSDTVWNRFQHGLYLRDAARAYKERIERGEVTRPELGAAGEQLVLQVDASALQIWTNFRQTSDADFNEDALRNSQRKER